MQMQQASPTTPVSPWWMRLAVTISRGLAFFIGAYFVLVAVFYAEIKDQPQIRILVGGAGAILVYFSGMFAAPPPPQQGDPNAS